MPMSEKTCPDLKLHFLWLAIGCAYVALVVYLSLQSVPVKLDVDFPYGDKVGHALAYFVMMLWFSQIYHDNPRRIVLAVVFIFIGISIEYLQSFEPNRTAEVADVVANVFGLYLGFRMTLGESKNLLMHFERFILKD
jgi:VanZ family protein